MNSERDIQQKFNERSINPSAEAWTRVATQLNKKNKRRKPGYVSVLSIAAGFIAILMISNWYSLGDEDFFSITKEPVPSTKQVNSGRKPTDSLLRTFKTPAYEPIELSAAPERSYYKERPVVDPDLNPQKVGFQKQTAPSVPQDSVIEKAIDDQVALLLAEVTEAEQEGSPVSDAAIDRLLQQAQDRIARRYSPQDAQDYSALALLEDVEDELDQSFRERVFDALRTGFEKAREAVASRNKSY